MKTFNDINNKYTKTPFELIIENDDIETLDGINNYISFDNLRRIKLVELHKLKDISALNYYSGTTDITFFNCNINFNIINQLNKGFKIYIINCEFVDLSFFNKDTKISILNIDACKNIYNFKSLNNSRDIYKLTIDNCYKLEVSNISDSNIEHIVISNTPVPNIEELLPFSKKLEKITLENTKLLGFDEFSNEKNKLTNLNSLRKNINDYKNILLNIKIKKVSYE